MSLLNGSYRYKKKKRKLKKLKSKKLKTFLKNKYLLFKNNVKA